MFNNILLNPELKGHRIVKDFTNKGGVRGYVEHPDHWEYTYFQLHPDDPNRFPQCLHRDRGYVIAAGWMKWESGLVQRNVALRGGQRYLCKAIFQPNVSFTGGTPPDWQATIRWRFWLDVKGGDPVYTDWTSTTKPSYGIEDEHLFVVEATQDVVVDYYFKVSCNWENNACDFNIYSLTMEEAPGDYGVPTYIGAGTAPAPVTQPPSQPEPPSQPTIPQEPIGGSSNEAEIEQIAQELRRLANRLDNLTGHG
ncbi:MAG: hypothetical protein D6737_00585 [Chloroflexi bacterium]|nr:MAG: hypothetical protein CUN54_01840 [Phototrophicales bacterium]RMF82862.1 MAG: hypothetical protein D6737_00585 [Chloroflexota bacterium]